MNGKKTLTLIVLILIATTALAQAQEEQIIVKLKKNPLALQAVALQEIQLFQQDLEKTYLMNIEGTTTYSYLHLGPGFFYGTISKSRLELLEKDERIEYIVEDREVITTITLETLLEIYQFASIIEKGFNGQGIKIAVIDTGKPIRTDLPVAGAKDFTGTGVDDKLGHSTAIVSIIKTISPKAEIYTYKALTTGLGKSSTIMRAIDQAVQDKMDIITLQIGASPTIWDPLKEMTNWAGTQTLVFVSAGNCGKDGPDPRCSWEGISSPGNAPNAITIGGLDQYGNKATFSPIAQAIKKPNAYALATNIEAYNLENGTTPISGNSFSAPIAAAYQANILSNGINNSLPLAAKKTLFYKGLNDPIQGWDLTTLQGTVYPPNALLIAIEPIIATLTAIVIDYAIVILILIAMIITGGYYLQKNNNGKD